MNTWIVTAKLVKLFDIVILNCLIQKQFRGSSECVSLGEKHSHLSSLARNESRK